MEYCQLDDAIVALNFISSDTPRDEWVQIGMALKSEFPDAFDVFDNWSQSSSSYKPRDCKAAWKSIKSGGAIGIGTLFKRAQVNGYEFKKRELTTEQKSMFAKERAERVARCKIVEATEQQERAKWHEAVAVASTEVWNLCVDSGESKYLVDKQVAAHGVGFVKRGAVVWVDETAHKQSVITGKGAISHFFDNRAEDISFRYLKPDVLIVPVIDENWQAVNLQLIYSTGKKIFLKHGRKSGCFFVIGNIQPDSLLVFVEGYATAASIYEATGWPVVVTFDCGNLVPVTSFFRKAYPTHNFLIAADDDSETKNAGLKKANEAAAAVGAVVVLPEFGEVANG